MLVSAYVDCTICLNAMEIATILQYVLLVIDVGG